LPDLETMKSLAEGGGGKVLQNRDDISTLLKSTSSLYSEQTRHFKVPVWDKLWLMALLLALLSAEWFYRKFASFK